MSNPLLSNDNQPSKNIWEHSIPYVIPPVAAAIGIVLPFRLFEEKAAQQLMEQSPTLIVKEKLSGKIKVKPTIKEIKNTLKRGAKAAPTIGIIIGAQMIAQETIESVFNRHFNKKKGETSDFFSMMVSSFTSIGIGAGTAPLLKIFNEQASGKSPMAAIKTVKHMTFKETGIVTLREATFLFSFRINKYVEKGMKNIAGDNIAVDYFAAFTSGVIGAGCGHPFDTLFTLWNNGKKICTGKHLENNVTARAKHIGKQLARGAFPRAMAVGFFAVCYKFATSTLSENSIGNK